MIIYLPPPPPPVIETNTHPEQLLWKTADTIALGEIINSYSPQDDLKRILNVTLADFKDDMKHIIDSECNGECDIIGLKRGLIKTLIPGVIKKFENNLYTSISLTESTTELIRSYNSQVYEVYDALYALRHKTGIMGKNQAEAFSEASLEARRRAVHSTTEQFIGKQPTVSQMYDSKNGLLILQEG